MALVQAIPAIEPVNEVGVVWVAAVQAAGDEPAVKVNRKMLLVSPAPLPPLDMVAGTRHSDDEVQVSCPTLSAPVRTVWVQVVPPLADTNNTGTDVVAGEITLDPTTKQVGLGAVGQVADEAEATALPLMIGFATVSTLVATV